MNTTHLFDNWFAEIFLFGVVLTGVTNPSGNLNPELNIIFESLQNNSKSYKEAKENTF